MRLAPVPAAVRALFPPASSPRPRRPLTPQARRATALITATQMLGWGSTYHLPVVLGRQFGADLDLAPELVFAGLSLMLTVSALLAPRAGLLIDRFGPGPFLCSGSLFAAAGLFVLSRAGGLAGYALAWALFGLALTNMLGNAAFVALARVVGGQARRAITGMLLFSALNPFILYPLTGYLSSTHGWRWTCVLYGCAHLVIGLPLHIVIARLKPAPAAAADAPDERERFGVVAPDQRRGALLLTMAAFSSQGLIGWGVQANMINMLISLGLPAATAIFVASLHGPSQLAGRLIDFGSGGRMDPLRLGLAAAALAPAGMIVLLFSGEWLVAAFVGVGLFGMSAGLNSIVRATIPLHLFGREGYGATLGRIALPTNIACGAAPVLFAFLNTRVGPIPGLIVGAAVGAAALWVSIRLLRLDDARPPVATP